MKQYLGLIILSLSLMACSKEEAIHDIEYYTAHENERVTKIEWCDKSAERAMIINCMNAYDADAKIKTDIMMGEGVPIKSLKKNLPGY